MKKDNKVVQDTIVSLIDEKRSLQEKVRVLDRNLEWYKELYDKSCETHDEKMREEKEKYALLLERYISMMERVAKIGSENGNGTL